MVYFGQTHNIIHKNILMIEIIPAKRLFLNTPQQINPKKNQRKQCNLRAPQIRVNCIFLLQFFYPYMIKLSINILYCQQAIIFIIIIPKFMALDRFYQKMNIITPPFQNKTMKYTLKMKYINFPAMSLYEAEKIIGKRNNPINKICEYKVKWQGYSIRQCTWEPIKNLKFVRHLIQQYQGQSKIKFLSSKNPCKDLKTISLKENDKHVENNLQRTVKKTSKCRQLKSNKPKIKISKLSRHIEKKNRQVRLAQLKMKENLLKQRYNRDLCEENFKHCDKISRDPFQLHFQDKVPQSQFRVLKACLKKGQKQLYYLVEQSQEKRLMKRQIVIREHSLALINFYEQRLIFTDKKSKIEK